jgi:hypothetical protein
MQFSALNTIPSLEGKPREIRLLFAEAANEAISKGRTTDEAIFQALAKVKSSSDAKAKKYVKPKKPRHLQALLDITNTFTPAPAPTASDSSQTAITASLLNKAVLDSQAAGKDIASIEFDAKGRLILKFKDGRSITSNVAPITAVEHSVLVVENGTSSGTSTTGHLPNGVDGGSATSVFQSTEVIDGGSASV